MAYYWISWSTPEDAVEAPGDFSVIHVGSTEDAHGQTRQVFAASLPAASADEAEARILFAYPRAQIRFCIARPAGYGPPASSDSRYESR